MSHDSRVPLRPFLVCWALVAAALIVRAILTAGTTPLILDTDDAMRLTVVHDFLAGQGWFDHIQYRLNTPWGGEIHWSRLIDLPQALLLLLFRPLAGPAADTLLAYTWPLLLLGAFLWLTARIAIHLGGRHALWPALLLPAFSVITLGEFAPGRLDHHSAQILLALLMLLGALLSPTQPRGALVSGIAAGVALAIGIEALPLVGAAIVVHGMLWVADPRRAVAMRDFGLAFAVTTTLGLAQGFAPDRWFVPGADAISITYVLAAVLCGAALLVLSLTRLPSWRIRLVAGILAGGVVLAAVVASYPPILRGPYSLLDPWLLANWIDRISEAMPWTASFLDGPIHAVAVGIPVLAAVLIALWNIVRVPDRRTRWLIYLTFLVIALAVMALQIRASRFAVPLAGPAGAVLIGAAFHRMVHSKGFGPIFAVLGSISVSAGIFVAVFAVIIQAVAFPQSASAALATDVAERNACNQPAAFTALAALPPARIMSPIDLGSHILLFTPHSVVSAPYHRNGGAILDTYRFFNGPIEEGRAILRARGIDYLVICPAMNEVRGFVEHTADSFITLFAEDRLPAWLRDETPPGATLRIYSVEP